MEIVVPPKIHRVAGTGDVVSPGRIIEVARLDEILVDCALKCVSHWNDTGEVRVCACLGVERRVQGSHASFPKRRAEYCTPRPTGQWQCTPIDRQKDRFR